MLNTKLQYIIINLSGSECIVWLRVSGQAQICRKNLWLLLFATISHQFQREKKWNRNKHAIVFRIFMWILDFNDPFFAVAHVFVSL